MNYIIDPFVSLHLALVFCVCVCFIFISFLIRFRDQICSPICIHCSWIGRVLRKQNERGEEELGASGSKYSLPAR